MLAPALYRSAYVALAFAVAINLGGVDEVDTGLQAGVEHSGGRRRVQPATEIVGAKPDDGYLERSDIALLHFGTSVAQPGQPRQIDRFAEPLVDPATDCFA